MEKTGISLDGTKVNLVIGKAKLGQAAIDKKAKHKPGWAGTILSRIRAGSALRPVTAQTFCEAIGCEIEDVMLIEQAADAAPRAQGAAA